MFKKFIKKHNKKIIAFIGVLATTICGVLGITKTYAYESDEVSYTLDTDNISKYGTSDFVGSSDNLVWELNTLSDNYNLILNIPLLETLEGPNNDLVLLCNLRLQRRSSAASGWQNYVYNGTRNVLVTDTNNTQILSTPIYFNTYTQQTNNSLVTYYGFMVQKSNNTNISQDISTIRLSLGNLFNNSYLYKVTIMNIDLVRQKDVVTLEYVNNYYGGIQAQLEQLQEDYENLENDYDTLQDNYTDLESNYNDLQDDYTTLQNEYNDLSEDYRNLYYNTNYGIWNFLSYEIVTLINPNYSPNETETYRYEGYTNWVKNDIIELNTLNITKAITRNFVAETPPFTIDCDSWNIAMNFSVYNHPSYVYYQLPTETLDLQIDTNINFNEFVDVDTSNYISIIFQLSNYDNYTTGNFIYLNISRDFLNRNGFRITKENLQEEFPQYDLNYYNNIMSIYVGSNYQLNTEDKFNIISTNAVIDRDYQLGYADGRESMSDTINALNTKIANLNGEITNMQLTINALNEQLNSTANDYNLNNLIWTIGGTPFESFKHIWNVNFFGVNVADFILGFITTFIGLFIFKKFFF